ncbi:signal peptidase I [Enterococcus sp. DIV0187]
MCSADQKKLNGIEGKLEMKSKGIKIVNIFFWFFLLLIIVLAIWFRFSDKTDKSLFGYRIYSVKTNSMKTDKSMSDRFKGESFEKGDLLFVKLRKPSSIKVNDVVTFVPNGIEDNSIYLTHRVIKKDAEKDTVVTRGDANNMDDPEISNRQIIGIVSFVVPMAGKLLTAIQENPLIAIGLAVIFILLLSIISKFFFSKA